MLQLDIKTKGVETTLKLINDIPELDLGKVGEVFSAGAQQRGQRYELFVMGKDRQAEIHQGRWQTQEDLAQNNAEMVAEKFQEMADALLGGRGLNPVFMRQALIEIMKQAKIYPPPPPNSTYRRTDTLKNSWRWQLFI